MMVSGDAKKSCGRAGIRWLCRKRKQPERREKCKCKYKWKWQPATFETQNQKKGLFRFNLHLSEGIPVATCSHSPGNLVSLWVPQISDPVFDCPVTATSKVQPAGKLVQSRQLVKTEKLCDHCNLFLCTHADTILAATPAATPAMQPENTFFLFFFPFSRSCSRTRLTRRMGPFRYCILILSFVPVSRSRDSPESGTCQSRNKLAHPHDIHSIHPSQVLLMSS
ncbi:hypothetical protein QBC44DRAFT_17913 [Cladorrhinum sp. PSN332]|nr:hypothetical protein QBC44DRAFT_17913 [Cladorrhinum sp. PSN332]